MPKTKKKMLITFEPVIMDLPYMPKELFKINTNGNKTNKKKKGKK